MLTVENFGTHPITINLSEYDKKTGQPLTEAYLLINIGVNEEGKRGFTKELWARAAKDVRIRRLIDNGVLRERMVD